MGGIQADQSISFPGDGGKLQDFMKIIREDPAVDNVTALPAARGSTAG
ncbi:hypothetical protein RKJ43_01215 [Klebsiella pneumoniae]|nr:hypothetical protein [Klebsiella pneumoniae]